MTEGPERKATVMPSSSLTRIGAFALSLWSLACQADSQTRAGIGASKEPVGPADVVIVWSQDFASDAPAPPLTLVVADFTGSELTLELPEPPPKQALVHEIWSIDAPTQYTEAIPPIGVGYILGLTPGAVDDPEQVRELFDYQGPPIEAEVTRYGVIYVPSEIAAGSAVEKYLCGRLSPGYHLAIGELAADGPFADCPEFGSGSEQGGAIWAVAPDDLDTVVTVEPVEDWR